MTTMAASILHSNSNLGKPDKVLGLPGPSCKMWIRKHDNKQVMRIEIQAGFEWSESIKPILPGKPDWCPSSHFGFLESGLMKILMEDGSIVHVNAGETYFIPPRHRPEFLADTTMIEFTQDTTFTNENFIQKKNSNKNCLFRCWLCHKI